MAGLRQYASTAAGEEPWLRAPQVSNSGITWQQNDSGEWVKFENDVVPQIQDDELPVRSRTANGRKLPSLSVRTDMEGFVGLLDGSHLGRTGGSPGRSAPGRRLSTFGRSDSRGGSGTPMRSDSLGSKASTNISSQLGRMSSKGSSEVSVPVTRRGSKGFSMPGDRMGSKGSTAGVERMGSKEAASDRQSERTHPDGSSHYDGPRRMSAGGGSRNTTPRNHLQVPSGMPSGRRRSCPLPTVELSGQAATDVPKSTPRASQFRRKRAPVAELDEPDYESRHTPRASVSVQSHAGYSQPTPSTASSTPAAPRRFAEPEDDVHLDDPNPASSGQATEEVPSVVSPVRQDGRRASVRLLLKNSEEAQPPSEKAHESKPSRLRTSIRSIMRQPPPEPPPPEGLLSPKEERLKQLRELHEAEMTLRGGSPVSMEDRMTIAQESAEDDFSENFVTAR